MVHTSTLNADTIDRRERGRKMGWGRERERKIEYEHGQKQAGS